MKNLQQYFLPVLGVLLVIVLILVNTISAILPWKIDASPNHVYSLSASSKKILSSMKQKVTVTLYMSATLPPRIAPIKADLFDLLDEYKRYGKIDVTIVNPEKDPKVEQEALTNGVTKLQFSDIQNDQFSLKTGYFGALFSVDNRKEVLPALLNPTNLEYDITSAIYRLTRTDKPRIGIIAKSKFQLLTGLNAVLKQQFDFKLLDFDTEDNYVLDGLIYKDDRLTALTDTELKKLDVYVQSGHLLVIFADGVWIDEQIQTQDAGHGLNSFLKKYGIQINKDLVLSPYAETASFTVGGVNFITKYPFWLRAGKKDFSPQLAFVSDSMSPLFPWVSTVTLSKVNGVTTTPLIYAPVPSVLQKDPFQLLPDKINVRFPENQKQQFVIGGQAQKGKGTIIVIPDSRFIENSFAAQDSPNLVFVSKLFDTYLSHGALSGINSRNIQYTQLLDVPDSVKQAVRWLNILVPSTLLVVYGFWRYLKRRSVKP